MCVCIAWRGSHVGSGSHVGAAMFFFNCVSDFRAGSPQVSAPFEDTKNIASSNCHGCAQNP